MYRGVSIALVVVGCLLVIWGISATDSFSSDVSRLFTGSPTDRSIWLLCGGILLGGAGAFGLFRWRPAT